MQTVRIAKKDLVAAVTANRAKHHEIAVEAQAAYRKAAIDELIRMLDDATNGEPIRRHLLLAEPIDQTEEYDRLLTMLAMSADDVVELNQHEFDCYVMDRWAWKGQFTSVNSAYSGKARGL